MAEAVSVPPAGPAVHWAVTAGAEEREARLARVHVEELAAVGHLEGRRLSPPGLLVDPR